MKKKVLISALGGSLFPYAHNVLKDDYELFYVDSNIDLIQLYPDLNFHHAPSVISEEYIPFIENLILFYNIEIYIPLIDEEILKAHYIKERKPDLLIVLPTLEFCTLCLNKDDLMKSLENTNISTIKSVSIDQFLLEPFFPAIIKPICGRGSRGIQIINNLNELSAYFILNTFLKDDIFIQEYINGTEYTIGVLENNLNQILSINSRKIITKRGITIKAITETNDLINLLVLNISKQYKPCGPYNIQLMEQNGKLYVFEINPRFSTTLVMSLFAKINEIKLFIEYNNIQNNSPIIFPPEKLILHRTWQNNFYYAK